MLSSGFTLVCPSLQFHLPVSFPSFLLPPFLVCILSYMSLPCDSPSFNCPLSLSRIFLQCLPNFLIPYFISLEFHSPDFYLRLLSSNSSYYVCSLIFPPMNSTPRNIFLSDDDFMFFPTEINEKTTHFFCISHILLHVHSSVASLQFLAKGTCRKSLTQ